MEMLAYTKRIIRNKFLLSSLFAPLFFWISCADDADMRLLYDDAKNHKVFRMAAFINPVKKELAVKDTLWITIELPENTVHDLVTDNLVRVAEAQYICQLELVNIANEDEVVDATFVVKDGMFYEDHSVSSTTSKNGYGFSFGYPEKEKLTLGLVPNKIGDYAIWFNNFPNPFHGCKGNSCDQGRGYWYDIYHQWDSESQAFEKSDFVDYVFALNENEWNALELDKDPYLQYSIYPESIYFFKVK